MPLKGNFDPLDILLTKDYLKNYFPVSCFLSFALFSNPHPKSRGSLGTDSSHIFQGIFSPGCCDVWTERRSLSSHLPKVTDILCPQMSSCHWNILIGQTGGKQQRRKKKKSLKSSCKWFQKLSPNDKRRHLRKQPVANFLKHQFFWCSVHRADTYSIITTWFFRH